MGGQNPLVTWETSVFHGLECTRFPKHVWNQGGEQSVENYSRFWPAASEVVAMYARVQMWLPFLGTWLPSHKPTTFRLTNHFITIWGKNQFLSENLQTTSGKINKSVRIQTHRLIWMRSRSDKALGAATSTGLLLARWWHHGDNRSRDWRDLSRKWFRRLSKKNLIGLPHIYLVIFYVYVCLSDKS